MSTRELTGPLPTLMRVGESTELRRIYLVL